MPRINLSYRTDGEAYEIMPTDYKHEDCGCLWIGYRSYIGNEIYWHKRELCDKHTRTHGLDD